MADRADIRSIDGLSELRLALARFVDRARPAVDEVAAEVLRLRDWLEGEQTQFWRQQLRRREAKLNDAMQHLRAMQMTGIGGACRSEQRQVSLAQEQVEEAERKLAGIRHWLLRLDAESREPLARCQQLSVMLDTELPAADHHLKQLITHLEAYAQSTGRSGQAPSTRRPAPGPETDDETAPEEAPSP